MSVQRWAANNAALFFLAIIFLLAVLWPPSPGEVGPDHILMEVRDALAGEKLRLRLSPTDAGRAAGLAPGRIDPAAVPEVRAYLLATLRVGGSAEGEDAGPRPLLGHLFLESEGGRAQIDLFPESYTPDALIDRPGYRMAAPELRELLSAHLVPAAGEGPAEAPAAPADAPTAVPPEAAE